MHGRCNKAFLRIFSYVAASIIFLEPIQSRCAVLRYSKLTDAQILKRLLEVCEQEHVDFTDDGLEAIVFTAQGDMRQVCLLFSGLWKWYAHLSHLTQDKWDIPIYIPMTNRICHQSLMQTEKSQPKGKKIMLETRFTKFPALSIDLRVGISRSASETNVWLFFLPMTLKIINYHSLMLLLLTFYIA